MSQIPAIRPDIDVHRDIQNLIIQFGPLAHDRAHFQVDVKNGHVVVAGNLKSRHVYEYLLNKLPTVDGVQSVDHSRLYEDEEIRRQVARLVPPGMFVNVEYGLVKLTGTLTGNTSVEEMVRQISSTPGINRIVTAFRQG